MNYEEERHAEKLLSQGWKSNDQADAMLNNSTAIISRIAMENGRMRFLIGEAITYMSHAETFIGSREKMHAEGRRQWVELIDRLREFSADREPEPLGNESALLVGGE